MTSQRLPNLDPAIVYGAWRSHALWNKVHPAPPAWEDLPTPLRGSWACLSRTLMDYHQSELADLAVLASCSPRHKPWWKLW